MNPLTLIRNLTLLIALLGLVSPALAFTRGECCGTVGAVCISRCTQDHCSGDGDCKLDRTTLPSDTDASAEGFEATLSTLNPDDQRELQLWITLPPPPIPSRDPDYEPGLVQQGGNQAFVPMKHGSCGLNCQTHVLAVTSGNLDITFTIDLDCPFGLDVSSLSYEISGQAPVAVVEAPTPEPFSQNLVLQPFSKNELEAACRSALGGNWAPPGDHNNAAESVETHIDKEISVTGECTGLGPVLREYAAELTIECKDTEFP